MTAIERARIGLHKLIARPVDSASLAAFRIGFGLLLSVAMIRFLLKGWVHELYFAPRFLFTYPGFGWVRPFPEWLMHAHFVLLAFLGLAIALGFLYRLCIVLFFFGFTYVELLDRTAYLNHYYLVSLLCLLMVFLPANRIWSIDALLTPRIPIATAPAWTLNILRFQIAVVYIFAGIAKLNSDWMLHAQPLRIWLAARSDLPLIGGLLDETWVAFAASWFGVLFDLSIVFFLSHKRTRLPAYGVLLLFHLATAALFNIGMFPWIMMLSALVFFSPSWPRLFLPWLQRSPACEDAPVSAPLSPRAMLVMVLALYAAVQVILPLRAGLSSTDSAWSRCGFDFAWKVMLAEKAGYVEFYACDRASGRRWRLPTADWVTPRQQLLMAQDPHLIRAMACHLSRELKGNGFTEVEVRAEAYATLNGRVSQRLIPPEVDLAGATSPGWILPLAH